MNIRGAGSPPGNEINTRETVQKKQPLAQPGLKSNSDSSKASGELVNLSSEAKEIRKLEKSLLTSPDVDQQRVDEVKQALDKGELVINSRNVAEKLLGVDKDF